MTFIPPQPLPPDLYLVFKNFGYDGIFTPAIRALLRQKRKSFHLTQIQLGKLFSVTSQTIVAWEKGHTLHCSICHRELVLGFITGLYIPGDCRKTSQEPPLFIHRIPKHTATGKRNHLRNLTIRRKLLLTRQINAF